MRTAIVWMLLLAGCAGPAPSREKLAVETGLDVLVRNAFAPLRGKRVGVITNHTGRTKNGRHIVDLLHRAEDVKLNAIFGPEHGVRGIEPDGARVEPGVDPATGVPVYSLYGKTRRPTAEMLRDVDVLVFDIQDVGARFYTYIYTMALAMEAAARHGKGFLVLDRPNPIGGTAVEGPLLARGFESFVGLFPIPVRHGMTAGELARLFKGAAWLEGAAALDLDVVELRGWKRSAWFDETDLPWQAPSPSMRTLATATVYPGTCLIEGTNVSEGRGTERPFELIGAPGIEPGPLVDALQELDLPGVRFEPVRFTPAAIPPSVPRPKFEDRECGGVLVRVVDREVFQPVRTGVSLLWTIHRLHPARFRWRRSIDRLYGSDRLRRAIDRGDSLAAILAHHSDGLEDFLRLRARYLLYPEPSKR